MTVSAQTPINRSIGNGVTTVFPYGFKILNEADILVTVDGVVKTLNVDYTVSGVGVEAGGNVTFTVAPANLTSVVRRRAMALVRTNDYQDQGELPAATLDEDLDSAILMIQQVDEQIDRALTLPAGVTGVSAELPEPEASMFLGWNAAGDAIENYAGAASVPVSPAMVPVVSAPTLADARAALGAAASGAIVASGLTMVTNRLLGRTTAATGAIEEISAGSGLSLAAGILSATTLRGHLDGLTLSTAGASATMSVAAGQAVDSTAAVLFSLAAGIGKTTAAWAVGTGNGGLDTGAIANATWYYFYLIRRPDTGVVDVVFSTNSAAPTLPANYTQYRYIGAGLTNGSAQWTKFIQIGDEFWWDTPVRDYGTNGSAAAATLTCTLPRGRKMRGLFHTAVNGGGTGAQLIYLSDLSNADLAPSITIAPLAQTSWNGAANSTVSGQSSVWTNTSAQIRHRELNTELVYIVTLGWTDLRGRNA